MKQRETGVQIIADVHVTLQDAWKRRRGSAGKMVIETWLENVGAMKTFGTHSDGEPSESFPCLGVKRKKFNQRQKYNQLAAGPSLQESTTTHRGLKFLRERQEENPR